MNSDAWSLDEAWEQRWCPMVNGILFPDGSVVPVAAPAPGAGAAAAGPRTTLAALAARGRVEWTTLGPLARAASPDRTLVAAAGEGGVGGDGFVALMSAPDCRLTWLAFFDRSDAFEAIRFEEACVVARTSGGREYRFPVAAPERLSIS